ncbi:MAG: hypothetical protein GY771_09865 [bacterium]|nr:hypothetical protein [bacterium]
MAPGNDFAANSGADPSSFGFTLGYRLGEIELPLPKLMAQQADIGGGIAKAIRNDIGGQALHERGAQSLVAPLPIQGWVDEKVRSILHGKALYIMSFNISTTRSLNRKYHLAGLSALKK